MVFPRNHSEVKSVTLIKCFQTDGIIFVNNGVFHEIEFLVNIVRSKLSGVDWVDNCIILEFNEFDTVESGEALFVLG